MMCEVSKRYGRVQASKLVAPTLFFSLATPLKPAKGLGSNDLICKLSSAVGLGR